MFLVESESGTSEAWKLIHPVELTYDFSTSEIEHTCGLYLRAALHAILEGPDHLTAPQLMKFFFECASIHACISYTFASEPVRT